MEQRFGDNKRNVNVSIIIPARNEGENIDKCLDAIDEQETTYRFEIIVIDSGSTDQTVDIVRKYSPVKLVEIQPEDFGHGITRNLGAEMSKGDYIVFLNADAIPVDNKWLNSLIGPLTKDEETAAVYSRHIPKEGCYLYMSRDIQKSMPGEPMVRTRANAFDLMIFSTVSCAIRREIWRKYPFDDEILIAEDQEWAMRILEQGLRIAYEPTSRVYHSHNYTPRQLFEIKRKVGISTGRFNTRITALLLGFILILGGMVAKITGDLVFILFRSKAPFSRKLEEIVTSFKARVAGFFGRYCGWLQL